jgi:tetratricopeptide (TPR) repeat protein
MNGCYCANGIRAVEVGDLLLGLHCFEQIPEVKMSALELSYYAYCLAGERRAVRQAFLLMERALGIDRCHPLIYLNLGRIQQISGAPDRAIESFRRGIRIQRHPLLLKALERSCPRRNLLLPFLQRSNPVNVAGGRLLAKLF